MPRTPSGPSQSPPFRFAADTLAFTNELTWVYGYDAQGEWRAARKMPAPRYTLRCFAMTRSVLQFYFNARFVPHEPRATEPTYRFLIRQVVRSDPSRPRPDRERILIPGYTDLRSFSADWLELFQAECGGVWGSYFQRGNWRMIFPFSRGGQESTATQLARWLDENQPAILHLVTFPDLTLNHAVLVFDARDTPDEIVFDTYDPNRPDACLALRFDRRTRTFLFPRTDYFPGGPVNAYRIYTGPFL